MASKVELLALAAFTNAGKISNRQSAIYALTGWANTQERRLLRLTCGTVLPRERHRAWAERMIDRCKFLMRPGSGRGAILLPERAKRFVAALHAHAEIVGIDPTLVELGEG